MARKSKPKSPWEIAQPILLVTNNLANYALKRMPELGMSWERDVGEHGINFQDPDHAELIAACEEIVVAAAIIKGSNPKTTRGLALV